jgi:hypothetical protein
MPVDEQKIDEAVLALLYLTLHDDWPKPSGSSRVYS